MLNRSEPEHLSRDQISNCGLFKHLCKLVQSDRHNKITKLEMIVASSHINSTKLINSSFTNDFSERVQPMDINKCLDEKD